MSKFMDEEKQLKITLELIGPERMYCEVRDADYVLVEAEGGELGIMPGHTSLLDNLRVGRCVSRGREGERIFAVCGGLLEVKSNHVKILTRAAEEGKDIDPARAGRAKERAEKRLKSGKEDIDMARARVALSRALNRMAVHGLASREAGAYR